MQTTIRFLFLATALIAVQFALRKLLLQTQAESIVWFAPMVPTFVLAIYFCWSPSGPLKHGVSLFSVACISYLHLQLVRDGLRGWNGAHEALSQLGSMLAVASFWALSGVMLQASLSEKLGPNRPRIRRNQNASTDLSG